MNINIPETDVDHLDFYLQNDISPVRQDIGDLGKHLERRSSLYTKLGLPPLIFKDKNILEVGPGSGHNSLYVASCHPKNYDLLEPNKTAQTDIINLYENVDLDTVKPNLIKQKLEDFNAEAIYDIAICEAWLGVGKHERLMMKKLGSLVKPGGILITTIASPLGSIANGIRRVISWGIVEPDDSITLKTEKLLSAFSSHLDTIQDMSRLYEDWTQDTLINPGFITMCPSPDMFIDDLGGEYDIYDSFPKFTTDWRWYKSLYGKNKKINENFLNKYHKNIHNFFDYAETLPESDKNIGAALEVLSFNLMSAISEKENANETVIDNNIRDIIKTICKQLIAIHEGWALALNEVVELIDNDLINTSDISKLKYFTKIFGRELIYVSAIKK